MAKVNQVKIADLVNSSRRYAEKAVQRADVNGNGYVTAKEAQKLPVDLVDNHSASHFAFPSGSVKSSDLVREFTVMMEAFAKDSDKNRDGYLSKSEAAALPASLRDNFERYITAKGNKISSSGEYLVGDTTPDARIREHLAAFGGKKADYEKAFQLALRAVATDSEAGLPVFVRAFGGPDGRGLESPEEIDAEVKALLANGSMELLATDDSNEVGDSPAEYWIFSVRTDGQGDHGVWASVNRRTGETWVTNFN